MVASGARFERQPSDPQPCAMTIWPQHLAILWVIWVGLGHGISLHLTIYTNLPLYFRPNILSAKDKKVTQSSGFLAREKIFERKRENATWAFLREQMTHTKVYSTFGVLKFTVNGHKLTTLRIMGQVKSP